MKIIILCLLFIFAMCGSVISQNRKPLPLVYDISLIEVKKNDKMLIVSSQIKNLSNKKVVINEDSLLFRVIYSKVGKKMPQGGTTNGEALTVNTESPSGDNHGDYLTLLPKQSYTKILKLKIEDDFFEQERTFKLLLIYGQFADALFDNIKVWKGRLNSNEMTFEINKLD